MNSAISEACTVKIYTKNNEEIKEIPRNSLQMNKYLNGGPISFARYVRRLCHCRSTRTKEMVPRCQSKKRNFIRIGTRWKEDPEEQSGIRRITGYAERLSESGALYYAFLGA